MTRTLQIVLILLLSATLLGCTMLIVLGEANHISQEVTDDVSIDSNNVSVPIKPKIKNGKK